jgi:Pyruvate/2-oxoacid:ferredoxin oxidoreductase delta subunit
MGEGTDMKMWGRIIPVEQTITIINEILTFDTVSTFIEKSSCISVANCFCKSKRPCHHPKEVCMSFDEGAKFVVQKGIARFIDKKEAYELLKKTEDAGLIHISTNTKRGPKFVCNCCTCSCFLLKKLTESENPYLFSTSQVLPSIDLDECERCYRCADICPFEAIDGKEDPYLRVNRCVGCGLCAHHCPSHAISMVPAEREEEIPMDIFS